jgi:hypothetical protein
MTTCPKEKNLGNHHGNFLSPLLRKDKPWASTKGGEQVAAATEI